MTVRSWRFSGRDTGDARPPLISAGAVIAALAALAGVATPTIASLVQLAALALGIDYSREGLTLERHPSCCASWKRACDFGGSS
jgi:hypothetical protein